MPKRRPKSDHEAHIYMTKEEYDRLKKAADANRRSLQGQVMYYVIHCLTAEGR